MKIKDYYESLQKTIKEVEKLKDLFPDTDVYSPDEPEYRSYSIGNKVNHFTLSHESHEKYYDVTFYYKSDDFTVQLLDGFTCLGRMGGEYAPFKLYDYITDVKEKNIPEEIIQKLDKEVLKIISESKGVEIDKTTETYKRLKKYLPLI